MGNTLNSRANVTAEIDRQIQQFNITPSKLNAYWKASEASKKWQLLIFDAVTKSKLLYGMETVQKPEAMMKRIDAFQMKGLRKILGKNIHIGIEKPPTKTSWTKQIGSSIRSRISEGTRERRRNKNVRPQRKLRKMI